MELEGQHEALFPALASAFKLTRDEVGRIQAAQAAHSAATSIWGRTLSAGTRLASAARDLRDAAQEG